MESNYKVNINHLMALIHVIDYFDDFNTKLTDFISVKNNRNVIWNLEKVSKGKMCFDFGKAKRFYKENKWIIDEINKYSNIGNFICWHYSFMGKPDDTLLFMYDYLKNNRNDLQKIINLLKKLKELGFIDFEFNPELDFSNKTYSVNSDTRFGVTYLDNLEVLPMYVDGRIEYKTNGSNYKIFIRPSYDGKLLNYAAKITLNSLTFDADRLPKSITKEETFDKIVALKNERNQEYSIIRDSVDLSIGIEDLSLMVTKINGKFNNLDNVTKKEELLKLLENIKIDIVKMQEISCSYDESMVQINPNITSELLEKEKKYYKEIRYMSSIDMC